MSFTIDCSLLAEEGFMGEPGEERVVLSGEFVIKSRGELIAFTQALKGGEEVFPA
jgi:hypothetical protein